jgi:hypothetical protein
VGDISSYPLLCTKVYSTGETMNPEGDEVDVYSARGGGEWYASNGFGSRGQEVVINVIASSKNDAHALLHGLGISRDIHCHSKAQHIGSEKEYLEFLE